jgi:hypothetical protein
LSIRATVAFSSAVVALSFLLWWFAFLSASSLSLSAVLVLYWVTLFALTGSIVALSHWHIANGFAMSSSVFAIWILIMVAFFAFLGGMVAFLELSYH